MSCWRCVAAPVSWVGHPPLRFPLTVGAGTRKGASLGGCVKCSAPAHNDYLCAGCLVGLRVELSDVAGRIPDNHGKGWQVSLPDDLRVTQAKLDHLVDSDPVGGSGETPLVFKAHAGEALWVLHNVLTWWAAELGLYGHQLTPRALARWMVDHLDLVAKHPQAGELADEVTDAIHQARRAIDRPDDDRVFLGKCGAPIHEHTPRFIRTRTCPEELYAYPWIDVITCPNPQCLTMYRVTDRQEWLRERAQQHKGTATDVAGFLRVTGVACTPDQIRGYARSRHGRPPRIQPAGVNDRGHPTYLISDVLAAIKDRYTRRS